MWWGRKKDKSPSYELEKRLNGVLKRLGDDKQTLIDFSADRYISKIDTSKIDAETMAVLTERIAQDRRITSRLFNIELTAFAAIVIIYLNISETVTFLTVSFKASDAVLASLLLIHSVLQVANVFINLDVLVKVRISEILFDRCVGLDDSGLKRLMLVDNFNAFAPWVEAAKAGEAIPGWKYFVLFLNFLPIILYLSVIILAVPVLVITAAWSLAELNNWYWLYLAILSGNVLGNLSRLVSVPIIKNWQLNYYDVAVTKNFHKNAERYGFEDALNLLDDELSDLADEIVLHPSEKARSFPVAKLFLARRLKK